MTETPPNFRWTAEAHITRPTFDALLEMSRKHKCDFSSLVSVAVSLQLSDWSPSFRTSMLSLFGKSASAAVDALEMSGWLSPSSPPSPTQTTFSTPVDACAKEWQALTGEEIPQLVRRRIHSQVIAKYTGTLSRNPSQAVRLFRVLFPSGQFQSFAHDSFKFGGSMDVACSAFQAVPPDERKAFVSRWNDIWTCATHAYGPSSCEDPYQFVSPASSPRFDMGIFRSSVKNYSLRDALDLSLSGGAKKTPPSADALLHNNP